MADAAWKKTFRVENLAGEDKDDWRAWSNNKVLAFAQKKGRFNVLAADSDSDAEEGDNCT
jgi:hypothetical protein